MGIFDYLPDIDPSQAGELMLPSFPDVSLPEVSLPDVELPGWPGLPSDFLPEMPSIPEVGEIMIPWPERGGHSTDPDVIAAGQAEAQRGLERRDAGLNVVGMAGSDSIAGEDGPLFSRLVGNEDMQQFARLHDVEAAMAEESSGGGLGFTLANIASAGVGVAGTLWDSPETGASWADETFRTLGFTTGDYAGIQASETERHDSGG